MDTSTYKYLNNTLQCPYSFHFQKWHTFRIHTMAHTVECCLMNKKKTLRTDTCFNSVANPKNTMLTEVAKDQNRLI